MMYIVEAIPIALVINLLANTTKAGITKLFMILASWWMKKSLELGAEDAVRALEGDIYDIESFYKRMWFIMKFIVTNIFSSKPTCEQEKNCKYCEANQKARKDEE